MCAVGFVFMLVGATPGSSAIQQRIAGFTAENSPAEARYEDQFLGIVDPANLREHHEFLAKSPAEEGTPGAWRRVTYIEQQLESYGLEADIQTFFPYLADSREVRVTLEMVAPKRLSLPVKEDPRPWQENFEKISVGFNEGTPPADITAEAVYANYGRAEDYEILERQGVRVEGKIVLVRYGATQRSEKPYQAYIRGAAGLIMYSDPADDGHTRGTIYPEGPWRAPDGIQRGTVYRWTLYTGDPLTPGWAATKYAPRIPVEESNISQIPPTTPIGYGAARPLLENLTGPVAPESWQGGIPITYRLGGPGSTKVHLKIEIQYEPRAAWNVIARIPGSEEPDEMVVIGTHPDTWAYGARDNTSGVTSQLEMARGLGELVKSGWVPKRTLILGFFGAEERGITGSTEFTELMGEGMSRVVAFVNSDGTSGPNFRATAVPALDGLLFDVSKRIDWPGSGSTLYSAWSERAGNQEPPVRRPGGGTDYMPFLDHFGVPIISIGAGAPGGRYHCTCDDFFALSKFNDPGMRYQAAVAQVLGLVAMRLSGADMLPFAYSRYAAEVVSYLQEFDQAQRNAFGRSIIDVSRDIDQANAWAEAARNFEATVRSRLTGNTNATTLEALNEAIMQVERALLTRRGLPGRPWYTHQIYAPQFHNGFALQTMPGLHDALFLNEDRDAARAYESDLFQSLRDATAIFSRGLALAGT